MNNLTLNKKFYIIIHNKNILDTFLCINAPLTTSSQFNDEVVHADVALVLLNGSSASNGFNGEKLVSRGQVRILPEPLHSPDIGSC